MTGGTGQKLEAAATVIAGVASLVATLLSIVYETSSLELTRPSYSLSESRLTRFLEQINMAADVRRYTSQLGPHVLTTTRAGKTTGNRYYSDTSSAFF
jgi:hypothetical protein